MSIILELCTRRGNETTNPTHIYRRHNRRADLFRVLDGAPGNTCNGWNNVPVGFATTDDGGIEIKIELYKPYKTRAGDKAVIIGHRKGFTYSFLAYTSATKKEYTTTEDGFFCEDKKESPYDLIAPWEELKTGEMWVNIYVNHATCFDTKEEALAMAGVGFIACKRVPWTEGDQK